MKFNNRRSFLKNSLLGTMGAAVAGNVFAQTSTPRDAEGPFYPITPQKDKDADLTKVVGRVGTAKGTIIEIHGQVLDTDLNPVEDATIDLWQANSFGKYHHPHDNSDAPIDENFQSWAIIQSGKGGKFRFKTIMPGAYPYNDKPEDQRTPHIHMKIGKHGYEPVLTQMYFPDQEQNKTDGLYQRKTKEQQVMMTAQKTEKPNKFLYNILLDKL